MLDEWRPPRSPRSPNTPLSARAIQADVDDAFADDGDDEPPAEFTRAALPSRAELQRMAAGAHWNDYEDDEHGNGWTVDEARPTVLLEQPPSPYSFHRSRAPSLSPTRSHHARDTVFPISEPPASPATAKPATLPEESTIADVEMAMEAVDLKDRHSPAPTEPMSDPLEPKQQDGPHEYPIVHIDAKHRTVQSISSIPDANGSSAVSQDGSHAAQGSVDSSHSIRSSQLAQPEPSSSTSASFPQSPQSATSPIGRSTSSKPRGPSVFEKVLSKTRPTHLPPKNKEEDTKHLKDWAEMMRLSRLADDRRKQQLMHRRQAREAQVEASIPVWEREVLPDWTVARRDDRLKRLWWNGIPSKLRGTLWQQAIGNDFAVPRDSFARCSARGRRARESGVAPLAAETMTEIDEDISTTLCALHVFQSPSGPLYEDLRDLLCAFTIARADEGIAHYVRGTARISAMLLLNMAPDKAFISLRNLLERHCMRAFFGGRDARDEVEAYYRIFDTLLADCMPKIYFNFKQHQIPPREYLPQWFVPLFADHLPLDACARVWDGIVLHGDAFLFRAALALLAALEQRLFFPDRRELMEVLRGENRAAQEVARRATGMDSVDWEELGKYAQYGLDEDAIWARIIEMDDWWKEKTWVRLLQRELPDI
ncbi:rab-GTPase-TBC domain-containing protein [Auriculariales sp. MPI-PUGE-AT-0066]|nr:rab-GTPase-TBC domain-containing protein [Auriculariales sp. MPI-PUGE-AT-0066]